MSNAMEITTPGWKLMHKTGYPVCFNTVAIDFRGGAATVVGGKPPHKSSSKGLVCVEFDECVSWFYPGVYHMEWVSA